MKSFHKNRLFSYTVRVRNLIGLTHKDGRLPSILEGTSRLKELCMGEIPVIAVVQCPLRHAAMLRGTEYLIRDLFKNKENARELLEIATDSLIVWAVAVVQAGADILQISDPPSSGDMISAKFYKDWVFPYTKRMVSALKGTGAKLIMHICGDTSDRLELLAETGVDGLSLDAKVDFGFARETLGPAYLLMGNGNLRIRSLWGHLKRSTNILRKSLTRRAERVIFSSVVDVSYPIWRRWRI